MFILQIWNSLSAWLKLLIIVIAIVISLFVIQSFRHYLETADLKETIQQQKEQRAVETQTEVNKAVEKYANTAEESNKIIHTDSNKFSSDDKVLTDKYCRKFVCDYHSEDSSCFEWKKENSCR